jgi:hypothetical protein
METLPEENRKRVRSNEEFKPRKQGRVEDDYDVEIITTASPAIPMAVPEITCAQINDMFNSLVNGPSQTDITDDPIASTSRARAELSELGNAIDALIVQREKRQLEIQQQIASETAAAMRGIEASQIVDENLEFINEVVNAMFRSQQRLGRPERIALNRRIIQLITQSVTNSEVRRQLEEEGIAGVNIRGLFDALIKYCTAMASYSYNSAPTIIANLGSILAGSSIIAGTVCSIGSMNNGGSLLVFLSQLLQTGSSTAIGLYFLGRGGLPVQRMLENIGAGVTECVRSYCISIANRGQRFMNSLSQAFNEMLEADTIKSETSASSVSTASTAGSAVTAISGILSMPENEKIRLLENGDFAPHDDLLLEGQDIIINEVDVEEPLTQPSAFGSQGIEDIDGGRKRKSRCHMKMKSTRKGRKVRRGKGRMTKKGRKHHRTMKRYRTKGRR